MSKNNIIYSYLRTYLIVLIIPVIICSLYCIHALSIIEEDDAEKAVEELRYSASLVDSLLSETEGIVRLISDNENVKKFVNRKEVFSYPRTYKIIELQNTLLDISFTSEYIYDYFIYFDRSQVVINRKHAYTYRDFYDLYLHEEGVETYEEWYQQKKNASIKFGVGEVKDYYLVSEDRTIPMMSYEIPLVSYSLTDRSLIKIYIRESAIKSRMPVLLKQSMQFITDNEGNILFYDSNGLMFSQEDIGEVLEKELDGDTGLCLTEYDGEPYLFIKYYSEQSGLSYYLLQPSTTIKVRTFSVALYMFLIILFAVVIGIILSIRMSYKVAKPVNELIQDALDVGSEYDHKTIFSHLGKSFKKLKDTNSELREAIETHKPFMQSVFLEQLLYGNFGPGEDIKRNAEYAGFECDNRIFWVIIFKLAIGQEAIQDKYAEVQSLYILSVEEAIKKLLPEAWLVNTGEERVAVIMSLPIQQQEEYIVTTEKFVQQVRGELVDVVAGMLCVYGGTIAFELPEISTSYENAAIMQIYKQQEKNENVIWYTNQKMETVPYPSTEKVKTLLQQVLAGEVEGVYKSFKEIIQHYFIEDSFSPYMQNLLIDDLQINLVRIIEILEIDEKQYRDFYLLLEGNHSANLLERIRITQNLYMHISQYVYEQKSGKTLELSAVTAYIHLNYSDSSLSLTSVSEKFKVSEGYLSGMFKQEAGINFSSYVEKVRMDKAKELLKTGSMTIKEIADAVGYTSENSFCRAFKRVVGMNTSDWRVQEKP